MCSVVFIQTFSLLFSGSVPLALDGLFHRPSQRAVPLGLGSTRPFSLCGWRGPQVCSAGSSGARAACRAGVRLARVAVPMQALPSPGWCGGRAPGSAAVPSSQGPRSRTTGQSGEWGGCRKAGSEPRDDGHTAFSRMSCWEKILMINMFCGEELKALCTYCPSVVVCTGLQNGLASSFEVVAVLCVWSVPASRDFEKQR